MNNDQILIPDGWSYFAHRTNTSRWDTNPFATDVITTNKLMSAIIESDIYYDLKTYGKDHLNSYNIGQGEPFEIRCLIPRLSHVRTMDEDDPMKNIVLKEYYYDKRNFGGAYGYRHPSIPPKEELAVIGIGNHDEVFDRESKIIWTIPKRFIEFYRKELQNGNVRTIDLNKYEEELSGVQR